MDAGGPGLGHLGRDAEHRDVAVEEVQRLLAQHQAPHARPEPVGPDHQVEAMAVAAGEGHVDGGRVLRERGDAVAEAVLHPGGALVQDPGEMAAEHLDTAVGEALGELLGVDADRAPGRLLEAYVDMSMEHRAVTRLVVRDPATLGYLDLAARVVAWRRRVIALLVGDDADLAVQVRAVVAIGGLADCTVMFPDVADADLKVAAVDAALATLHG